MNKGIDKLKRWFEEEPVQAIVVGTLAVAAAAKLIDALSVAQGRRAYARQIEYKIKN